jgi:type IV pilus biogenesis protein CpaD/CtpE
MLATIKHIEDNFTTAYALLQHIIITKGNLNDEAAARAALDMLTEAENYGWDGVRYVKVEFNGTKYTITEK